MFSRQELIIKYRAISNVLSNEYSDINTLSEEVVCKTAKKLMGSFLHYIFVVRKIH